MKIMEIRVAGALILLAGFVLAALGSVGLLGSLGSFFFISANLDSALRLLISVVFVVGGMWLMERARLQ